MKNNGQICNFIIKSQQKVFLGESKRDDQTLRRMSKPEMSDGQEAPPEILTINKWPKTNFCH